MIFLDKIIKIVVFFLSFSFGFVLLAQNVYAADVWRENVNDNRFVESWNSMNIFALDLNNVPHFVCYDQNDQSYVDQ